MGNSMVFLLEFQVKEPGALNIDTDQFSLVDKLFMYKETVFRICLGFTKDPDGAEDLTQEVFLRAYRKQKTLKNINKKKEWLFKIARNTCLDFIKSEKRVTRQRNWEDFDLSTWDTPEIITEYKEQKNALKEAIKKLPVQQRTVFIFKEYAGMSYEEIARTLNIRRGTVMSRLNRARHRLIKEMRSVFYDKKK
jgi:RNA polymerase sigma-70 factor (ECF subfamily)